MLVLSRQFGERLMIGENIVIQIVGIRGNKVRLGITAPEGISVDREEVRLDKERERQGGEGQCS